MIAPSRADGIDAALAIDGWMTDNELAQLAEWAAQHERIVEVGSYLGRSTRALADHTPGVVYALDDWLGPRDVDLVPAVRRGLMGQFRANLSERIADGHCQPVRCRYDAVPLAIEPDMVFIDGSHALDDVRADIRTWRPRLKPGGLLCGHDGWLFSVANAVIAETGNLQLVEGTSLWYV